MMMMMKMMMINSEIKKKNNKKRNEKDPYHKMSAHTQEKTSDVHEKGGSK